jgi:WD40 repeat protein
LWDSETWTGRGPLKGHAGGVTSLAFAPDGATLASVTSADDTCLIRLWDVAGARPAGVLGGPGRGMWSVAYSQDGQTIACGGWDRAVHIWDVATGRERYVISDVAENLVRTV